MSRDIVLQIRSVTTSCTLMTICYSTSIYVKGSSWPGYEPLVVVHTTLLYIDSVYTVVAHWTQG